VSLARLARIAVGTEPAGATNGAIGSGVSAFQTKVVTVTTAGARGGTTPTQIGAVSSRVGVGAINSERRARQVSSPIIPSVRKLMVCPPLGVQCARFPSSL
jgi:hypothetical protein